MLFGGVWGKMQITLIRTVVLYAVVIAVMRGLGKRQVGELEPSELVITILISELAAVPMQDPGVPLLRGLVPIAVLFSLGIFASALGAKYPRLRRFLSGKPSIVICDGKYVQSEIKRLRLSVDEIGEELRLKGVTDVSRVKYGIVETNGQMSVIGFSGKAEDELPVSLICNGRLMKDNLRLLGLDRAYVEKLLKKRGIASVSEVFYMSRDSQGRITTVENEE